MSCACVNLGKDLYGWGTRSARGRKKTSGLAWTRNPGWYVCKGVRARKRSAPPEEGADVGKVV
ncbi:hypothetical protein FHS36_006609 [Streptomyces eurocidicus]|uniref:Uncharacterized protein n=1 Tax=Streptomyces eurocidicus TaxID=66423 RepID=A0A7W8BGX6_STREU|nr:hypothetical protein [Streptomyces eurocidicus]